MIIRIYHQKLGSRVHCRVFIAKTDTFAKCGELTVDASEWNDVRDILHSKACFFIEEEYDTEPEPAR